LVKNQELPEGKRAALYVDGFNLYHPIHDRNEPFLKWASLWKLGEIFCRPSGLQLQKVVFCTAVPQDNVAKRDRHNTFNAAQTACGVVILKGHHVVNPDTGQRSEKQSDINVALSLILDAEDDIYDWAFLLSADSDQAATAKVFSERYPQKALVGVAPFTKDVPEKVKLYCVANFVMTLNQLEEAIMPQFVPGLTGNFIRRPPEYEPPAEWVHPDNRPRRKKN
jgi:hypothetical protein